MDSSLKLAKEYQKNGKIKKACEVYEVFYKNNNIKNEDVYIEYAKCLKILGDVRKQEAVLNEGKNYFAKSEKILLHLNELYISTSEKELELSTAKSLLELDQNKPDNYFRLGSAYASFGNFEEAEKFFEKGLELIHGKKSHELQKIIQTDFNDNESIVGSEYRLLSGRNNYGAFIHDFGKKKYITKISKYNSLAKREEMFYKNICCTFPLLKSIVPLYISSKLMDGILYLTIEMIPHDSNHLIEDCEVIKASEVISSIDYQKLNKNYPNLKYSFTLKNKPNTTSFFFTDIHNKTTNQKLFKSLDILLKQNNYPNVINEVCRKLEYLIMNNYLYNFINPNKHYALIHGDYNQNNSIYDKVEEKIKIIDWETFKIGFKYTDIARYYSSKSIPFQEIKLNYLESKKDMESIEKIFFVYVLILMYILTIRQKNILNNMDRFIIPALKELEVLTKDFVKENYRFIIGNYQGEINELKLKLIKKEKRILKLEKNINNITNSKSWRFTRFLRVFRILFKPSDKK